MSKQEKCIFDRASLDWHEDGVPCSGEITRHHAPEYRCEGGRETVPCCRGHQNWLHAQDQEWVRRENADKVVPIGTMEEPVNNRFKDKRIKVQTRVRYH